MKKTTMASLAAPFVLATGVAGISERLYQYAFKRVNQVPETSAEKQKYASAYYNYVNWLRDQPTETWTLHGDDPQQQLVATYLAATPASKQTVIISHGYKGNGETMANYAQLFHELGYNVLLPDDRAHGKSAGRYITFGWLDRLDYLDWLKRIINHDGEDVQIVLFGVSMGGATVEMMSGEQLPAQVQAIIADCGYSSIDDELVYLLKRNFHLPKYPFLPAVSAINRRRLGFNLHQVSSVAQLKHNYRPILFIHGEKDVFVPASMLEENYAATQGPKVKWIVPNATHAESFWVNPAAYQQHVRDFLQQYVVNSTPLPIAE